MRLYNKALTSALKKLKVMKAGFLPAEKIHPM
jgi:hypothetical protein